MAGVEPDILIVKTPSSVDSIGFFMEERGRTFVVSQAADDISGASGIELVIEDDIDRIVRIVNAKFEARESQIKDELRSEFEDRLRQIERSHELSLKHLKGELSTLSKISLECEYLKTLQKELRIELDVQQGKIKRLTRENNLLKTNCSKSSTVTYDNERLKEENETLKEENIRREAEIDKLSRFITQKELEVATLKTQIDLQYKKIKLDLSNTRDKFQHEHTHLNADMKKHEQLLSEITEAVRHISKPTDEGPKPGKPVKASKEENASKQRAASPDFHLKEYAKRDKERSKRYSDKDKRDILKREMDIDKRDSDDDKRTSSKRGRGSDTRDSDKDKKDSLRGDRGEGDRSLRDSVRHNKDIQTKRPVQKKKPALGEKPFR